MRKARNSAAHNIVPSDSLSTSAANLRAKNSSSSLVVLTRRGERSVGFFSILRKSVATKRLSSQTRGVTLQTRARASGRITSATFGGDQLSSPGRGVSPIPLGKKAVSIGNGVFVFEVAKRVDYRALARDAVDKVKAADESAAVIFLTTIIERVANGRSVTISQQPRCRLDKESDAIACDPLAAARARGRRYALEQYEDPDNLALLEARDYAGRNERAINELRQRGELYALLPPGKTRGFRYPKWQFDAAPNRIQDALRPFVEVGANCWVIHSFLLRKRDVLKGRSPAEVVLDDNDDIKLVVDLAESDLSGDQGAQ